MDHLFKSERKIANFNELIYPIGLEKFGKDYWNRKTLLVQRGEGSL